jgi:hypothetical protein
VETRREIENIPVETRVLATQIQQLYTRLGMYGGGLFTQSSECLSLSLTIMLAFAMLETEEEKECYTKMKNYGMNCILSPCYCKRL